MLGIEISSAKPNAVSKLPKVPRPSWIERSRLTTREHADFEGSVKASLTVDGRLDQNKPRSARAVKHDEVQLD